MMQGITALDPSQPPASGVPPEAMDSLGQGFNSLDKAEVGQLRELQDDLSELSPDKLKVLEQIILFLKKHSDSYDQAVQLLVSKKVLEPGDLPPEYVPAFFEILDQMVRQALSGETKKFSEGGINSIDMPQSLKELQSWNKKRSSKKKVSPDDYFSSKQSGVDDASPVAMPSSLKELQAYNAASKGSLRDKASAVREAGTGGDKILAHINPNEAAMLASTRGGGTNPDTGLPEFGFFEDIGNIFKSAASVVLPVALGFMGVPPIFAGAIGSGVGALINGASPGKALQAAFMGGATGALFSGAQSWMGGKGFMEGVGQGFKPAAQGIFSDSFGGYQAPTAPTASYAGQGAPSNYVGGSSLPAGASATSPAVAGGSQAAAPGMFDTAKNWISNNPVTAVGIAGLGGLTLASAMQPEQVKAANMGKYKGPTDAEIQAHRYDMSNFTQGIAPRVIAIPTESPFYAAQGGELDARVGGHLHGPGTGTSDSIPAKLSDGEFVMTAKAVRGAGGGSRDAGAKKMYELMHHFEKRA